MNRHIGLRIIAGLVLLAALAGIAFFAYQAGVSQGVVSQLPAGSTLPDGSALPGTVPQSGYYPGWHYGRAGLFFGPFLLLRCLVALFLFGLAFSAFRLLLWGPRWAMHRRGMWGHGPWGHGPWGRGPWGEHAPEGGHGPEGGHAPEGEWKPGEGPQSMFDEWHRRAHEQSNLPKQ
jgi:hypothetical protein